MYIHKLCQCDFVCKSFYHDEASVSANGEMTVARERHNSWSQIGLFAHSAPFSPLLWKKTSLFDLHFGGATMKTGTKSRTATQIENGYRYILSLCIAAQLARRRFKRELCVQKRDATVTPGVLSLTRSPSPAHMFRRHDAVISVQTANLRGSRRRGGGK